VPASPGSTTWDIIQVSPQLSRLRELVVLAGLENELDSVTELRTIFAASNQAFEDFEALPLNDLSDPDVVRDLLLRHIVSGSLTSDNIFAQSCLVMRNDVRMPINDDDTIGDNEVHLAEGAFDIRSANGYLHAINQVLALPLPPFC
jgi:uncharacterized surface protein with fasciclin (FAS1) repeats